MIEAKPSISQIGKQCKPLVVHSFLLVGEYPNPLKHQLTVDGYAFVPNAYVISTKRILTGFVLVNPVIFSFYFFFLFFIFHFINQEAFYIFTSFHQLLHIIFQLTILRIHFFFLIHQLIDLRI